jgi:hypothetical protein
VGSLEDSALGIWSALQDPIKLYNAIATSATETVEDRGIVYAIGYVGTAVAATAITKGASKAAKPASGVNRAGATRGRTPRTPGRTASPNGLGNSITSNTGRTINTTPSSNHTTVARNPGPRGRPNSSVDILDSQGNLTTRRWFDSNGKAFRDVDLTNHGNPRQHHQWPHEHTWDWSSGNPVRIPTPN